MALKQHNSYELVDMTRATSIEYSHDFVKSTSHEKLADSATPIYEDRGSRVARFRYRHALTAWRLVLSSGLLVGTIVLLINLILLGLVYTRFKIDNGIATAWTGSCEQASSIVTILHLLINIMSSLLLASSNFSMQCLSAPTRAEIDRAHMNKQWLSIATPNIRNLAYVSPTKSLLWVILALSSFPLHLLWNSVVFETRSTNEYVTIRATTSFLDGGYWQIPSPDENTTHVVTNLQLSAQHDQLERLGNSDCIRAYAQNFIENRRNLILVTDRPANGSQANSSVIAINEQEFSTDGPTSYSWMCGADIDTKQEESLGDTFACTISWLNQIASARAADWSPDFLNDFTVDPSAPPSPSKPVQYCLSEKVDEKCHISILPLFLGMVILCNVLKIVCFIWTLRASQMDRPLLTTGDAIQSFLESPDMIIKGKCLAQKEDFESLAIRSKRVWRDRARGDAGTWRGSRRRYWGKAVRLRYWVLFSATAAVCIAMAAKQFGPDNGDGSPMTWSLIWRSGIGQPQPNSVLNSNPMSVAQGFLLANVPQIIASYWYLMVNSILSTMLAMQEWTSFATEKAKGLRVTRPVEGEGSEQRKTYFLSVPFRWAIPSIILAILLHWFCSQMLFLVRIEVIDMQGAVSGRSTVQPFFSSLAMLCVVLLASMIALSLILLSIFKRYPATAPLAGCCSASIAAACQPGRRGPEVFSPGLAQRRLRWGVVRPPGPQLEGQAGHATFSDGPVGTLIRNMEYA